MTIDDYLQPQDRFDALRHALREHESDWQTYLSHFESPFSHLFILRDWQGYLHIGIPGSEKFDRLPQEARARLHLAKESLVAAAGALLHTSSGFFFSDELFDAQAFWASKDKVLWEECNPVQVYWIERQVREKIWTQTPATEQGEHPLRIVFFGIKGGVGRSSALLAAAYHLMAQGKTVLVLDADFESPGVSSTLLADDLRPEYGLMDWFALDSLQPALTNNLVEGRRLVERSGLQRLSNNAGAVWVAPAYGQKTQDYVGKLGRLYQDTSGKSYVERFTALLCALEREYKPDVVLIDSRAGVDDTSALALTQLNAHSLLFATHGRATWSAYKLLFSHWQKFAELKDNGEDFRANLHVVSAALAPSNTAYDKDFLDASYRLFQEHLYEDLAADESEGERFNFGADDPDAPHYPSRVRWDDMLRNFDPIQNPAQIEDATFKKAFGELTQWIDHLHENHADAMGSGYED
jgi:cellulose biosynthesis protein BcsQ